MPLISVNHTTMEYIEAGSGAPLVLVHGSASDYRTWNKQIEPFSRQYHVIAYSRRYHYPNEWKGEGRDYTVALHVEDLAALIRSLGDTPVHIVGSSYGGYTALEMAIKYPALVKSLVLGEPPVLPILADPDNPLSVLKLLFRNWQVGKTFIKFGMKHIEPAKRAFLKNDMEGAIRLFGTGVLGEAGFDKMSPRAREAVMQNAPALKAELLGPGFFPFPSEAAKGLDIPTLFIYGERSPLFFHTISDKLMQLLPKAEKVIIPDASHNMHLENAEAYNRVVMEFLGKVKV